MKLPGQKQNVKSMPFPCICVDIKLNCWLRGSRTALLGCGRWMLRATPPLQAEQAPFNAVSSLLHPAFQFVDKEFVLNAVTTATVIAVADMLRPTLSCGQALCRLVDLSNASVMISSRSRQNFPFLQGFCILKKRILESIAIGMCDLPHRVHQCILRPARD
jgi:hypothetical protein